MSLNRKEKAVVIEDVTTQVATAQSIVVAEYRGLDVASVTVLRKTARESGVYLRVLKNSLARRAMAMTRNPSAARRCATSAPMPELAPVTSAKPSAGVAR